MMINKSRCKFVHQGWSIASCFISNRGVLLCFNDSPTWRSLFQHSRLTYEYLNKCIATPKIITSDNIQLGNFIIVEGCSSVERPYQQVLFRDVPVIDLGSSRIVEMSSEVYAFPIGILRSLEIRRELSDIQKIDR
jgi:hypothetical protein